MKVEVLTKDAADKEVALMIKQCINSKEKPVLGLVTGSTPEGVYALLRQMYEDKEISFKDVTTFNLEEYVGLKSDHPMSYRKFMEDQLFSHVDIKSENINFLDGMDDSQAALDNFEDKIQKAGGIDLMILGIGRNGHIGFNEPGTGFDTLTHVAELTESTREANLRFFDSMEDVPKYALTMGMHTIISAKKLVLMAYGEDKAQAIKDALEGDISENCPASYLRTHADYSVFLDKAAASLLEGGK